MKPSVVFSGVSHVYGEGDSVLEALEGVSLRVEPGQSVALIGPSGCGKSSALRMMAGLLMPSEGRVEIGGNPIVAPRQATAYIPQNLGLLPWKTVLQNVALGLQIRKVPKARALDEARKALDAVDLSGFERAYPKELSGGMKQRLALARALALDMDLLLMDEPLSAVDALSREALQDLLLDVWKRGGQTQVLVTHSIEEAVYLGQRIFVFSKRPGKLVATIENSQAGERSYRDSVEFAALCREVRACLAQSGGGEDATRAGAGGLVSAVTRDRALVLRADADEPTSEGFYDEASVACSGTNVATSKPTYDRTSSFPGDEGMPTPDGSAAPDRIAPSEEANA